MTPADLRKAYEHAQSYAAEANAKQKRGNYIDASMFMFSAYGQMEVIADTAIKQLEERDG